MENTTRSPVRPRVKTYSAQTGIVYQYVYAGYRSAKRSTDYVFSCWRRAPSDNFELVVRLSSAALAECSAHISRPVDSTEQYAIAKMTLFGAFDEHPDVQQHSPLTPGSAAMEEHLRTLGRL